MDGFEIKFTTDNDAFKENPQDEVIRILQDVATRISEGKIDGYIYDVNGNKVGYWLYT